MSTQEIFGKLTAHNSSPRPVPVYILADVSGSMAGLKIQHLNKAIAQMAQSFLADSDKNITFHMSVITFGSISTRWITSSPKGVSTRFSGACSRNCNRFISA